MKQRIYIDTSVIGGYFDEEFKDATRELFKRFENNEITFVVSDLLDLELIGAPKNVRELPYKFSTDKFERVELTDEAVILADTYIAEKVVGKTSLDDCRHIVNLDRIKGYNSVNYRLGYHILEIRSPKDLIHYED